MAEMAHNVLDFVGPTKKCPRCGIVKPVKSFGLHKKMGLQGYCKRCSSEASLEIYYLKNPNRPTKSKHIDHVNKLRRCLGCNEVKPWAAFGRIKASRNAPLSKCDPCRAKESREHRLNNLEQALAKDHKSRLKRKYGMTLDDYASMLSAQDNKCKICFSGSSYKKSGLFVVDHSHENGAVRGLLCIRCNSALGMFGDSPERLRLAANYIEKDGKL